MRGVNPDNYYRLNVEVGVGEFGMNEWSRLADISTSTRQYLAKADVQRIVLDAGAKMARIERAKRRHVNYTTAGELDGYEKPPLPNIPPPLDPSAVELPGEDTTSSQPHPSRGLQYSVHSPHPYQQVFSSQDKFTVVSTDEYQQGSSEIVQQRRSSELPYRNGDQRFSQNSILASPRRSDEGYGRPSPPPLPPKMPIPARDPRRQPHLPGQNTTSKLPYPDADGPPPLVNMARKPEYTGR